MTQFFERHEVCLAVELSSVQHKQNMVCAFLSCTPNEDINLAVIRFNYLKKALRDGDHNLEKFIKKIADVLDDARIADTYARLVAFKYDEEEAMMFVTLSFSSLDGFEKFKELNN